MELLHFVLKISVGILSNYFCHSPCFLRFNLCFVDYLHIFYTCIQSMDFISICNLVVSFVNVNKLSLLEFGVVFDGI